MPVERVVFNAITKEAVLEAMRHPREIDGPLVDAYLARRALDYLVGFTLSPVLWRKLPGARSAGRVQSVALRLVCDRELEIERFRAQEYWSVLAELATAKDETFQARLVVGRRQEARQVRYSRPGDGRPPEGGARRRPLQGRHRREQGAARATRPPPFTTSTLQQEASRKLGFSPRHTMQLAQRLYEGVEMGGEAEGLITYMRTDGVQIAPEAIAAARRLVDQALRRPLRAASPAPIREPRPRTRRKRTRPSGRPTSPRSPNTVSRISRPTRPSSTS